MVRLKNMSIFYQILPHFRCWHLIIVVVVGVSSLLLASWLWRLVVYFVVVGVSSLFLFFVGSGVPYCGCIRRLLHLVVVVIFVVVVVLIFFGYLFVGDVSLLLLLSASRRWCRCHWVSYRWRRLVVVIVVVLLFLLSSSAAASCRCRYCCWWRRGVLWKY